MQPLKTFFEGLSPLALGVAACCVTGSASAVLYGFGPAESWTIVQIGKLSTSVGTNIATFGSTFGANMALKFEQVISAVAVATKQEALAGSVVADAGKQSAEQLVNAVRAQKLSDQAANAILDYTPAMAQGYEPCVSGARNKTLDNTFDALGASAKNRVAALDVAPGAMVASTGAAMTARLANHRTKFCSEAEAQAGLCSVSTLPGGDTNGALLFLPTQPGSLQEQAQKAYMQHVLGAPDQVLPKGAGTSPAGQAYMLEKNSKDALMSIPAYSLSMVQAANLRSADTGDKSANEVLRVRVNQYFGGKEAFKWSQALMGQSERGLMVEAVKMNGLEVWLHHKQYQQNQRLELNLAALALAASEEAKAGVDAKYAKMMRDTATGAIQ